MKCLECVKVIPNMTLILPILSSVSFFIDFVIKHALHIILQVSDYMRLTSLYSSINQKPLLSLSPRFPGSNMQDLHREGDAEAGQAGSQVPLHEQHRHAGRSVPGNPRHHQGTHEDPLE